MRRLALALVAAALVAAVAVALLGGPPHRGAPLRSVASPNETGLQSVLSTKGLWVNDSTWSIPVYQPCVGHLPPWAPCSPHDRINVTHVNRVTGWRDPGLTAAWQGLYVAAGFKPSNGSDHTAIIRSFTGAGPELAELWELRKATRYQDCDPAKAGDQACEAPYDDPIVTGRVVTDHGWLASWGGASSMAAMGKSDGLNIWPTSPNYFGISASGISYFGDIVMLADLKAGAINHPISFSVPNACQTQKAPATRNDGLGGSPCIQYGAKFKLAPINVDTITTDLRWCGGTTEKGEGFRCPLTPAAKMMAKAAQTSYLVATDQSYWGNPIAFSTESWDRPRTDNWTNVPAGNPFAAYFGCDGYQNSGHYGAAPVKPGESESDCAPSLQAGFKGFPWQQLFEVP